MEETSKLQLDALEAIANNVSTIAQANVDLQPIEEISELQLDALEAIAYNVSTIAQKCGKGTATVEKIDIVSDTTLSVHDSKNYTMLEAIDDKIGNLATNIVQLDSMFKDIGDKLADAGKALKGLGDLKHIQTFVDKISKLSLDEVREAVRGRYDDGIAGAAGVINRTGLMDMSFGQVIGAGFDTAWRGIQAVAFGGAIGASYIANEAKGFMDNVASGKEGTAGGAVRGAAGTAKEALKGVYNQSLSLAGTIIGGVQKLAGKAMDALPAGWDKILKGFNWVKDKLLNTKLFSYSAMDV